MGVFWTKSPCSSPRGVMFVSLGMLVGFIPGKSCVRLPRGTAVTPLGFCSPGFREALSWCTAERMNGASSLGEDMRMGISQPGCSDPVFSSWTYLILVASSPVLSSPTHLAPNWSVLRHCSSLVRLTTWFHTFNKPGELLGEVK